MEYLISSVLLTFKNKKIHLTVNHKYIYIFIKMLRRDMDKNVLYTFRLGIKMKETFFYLYSFVY